MLVGRFSPLTCFCPGICLASVRKQVCSMKDRSVIIYKTKDTSIRALDSISALQWKLVHIDVTLVPWTNKSVCGWFLCRTNRLCWCFSYKYLALTYFYPGPALSDWKLRSPGKCLCDAVAGQCGAVVTGKGQGNCNLIRMWGRGKEMESFFVIKSLTLKKKKIFPE